MSPAAEIRIIALDLDGTLLDSEKRLPAANVAALAELSARGIHIVPCTGRFFGAMPEPVRQLPFVRYAITINGAQVFDRETSEAVVREELPLATALEIMRLLDGFDCIYDCYHENWGRMTAALQARAADYAPDAHYLRMIRELRKPYPDLKRYLAEAGTNVQKIMLFTRDPTVRAAIRRELDARFADIAVTSSTPNNWEINAKTAHKGVALARFAAHLGLALENCLAFGDGQNDLTMIEAAGIGVCMSNGAAEVKAAADIVAPSCDDAGVAQVLHRLFNLTEGQAWHTHSGS